jgi:hypothetical protein
MFVNIFITLFYDQCEMCFNAYSYVSAMQNAGSKAKSGDNPPKIVSHLKSDFVNDGAPVTLSCRIIGILACLNYENINIYINSASHLLTFTLS